MTRVLLADDHGLVLAGLQALLETDPDIEVAGTCVDGEEVLAGVAAVRPDVLVMDLQMPRMDGIDTLMALRAREILPPTIVITGAAAPHEIDAVRAHGAWGVVMKDEAPTVIVESIHAVAAGETWSAAPERTALSLEALTARERQVVCLAGSGASNKAIARELGIAVGTVKAYLHTAYQKLDITNRVELALLLRSGPPA